MHAVLLQRRAPRERRVHQRLLDVRERRAGLLAVTAAVAAGPTTPIDQGTFI